MKHKGTLYLALVAAFLGGYIYFFEIKKAGEDEKAKIDSQRVFSFDQEKARKLTFKNSFGEFILEKDAQNIWKMTKPVEDTADDSNLMAMFTALNNESSDQVVVENETNLTPFGLDNPKYSLEVYFGTGETKTLFLGADAPLNGKLYAMRSGEKKVLLANLGLKYQLDKGMRDLRDKRIFRGRKDSIHGIRLSTSSGVVELKSSEQKWEIVKPIKEVADFDSVQAILSAVDNLRATDFTEGVDKKVNLDKPQAEITLMGQDGKVLDIITIGAPLQTNAYVRTKNSKTIYQVYLGAASQFAKSANDFRDKKSALAFEKESVKEFLIKTALIDYSFTKKGDVWELSQPDPKKEVNQLQVSQLLAKLADMKVAEYIDKPRPFGKEKGKIILKNEKGETLLDFKWADSISNGKNILVSTQKYQKPFGVDAASINTLPGQTLIEEKGVEKDNSQKPHAH